MAKLTTLVISLVMVILASFCIVTFAILYIGETNPTSPIFSPEYTLNSTATTMQNSLDDFTTTSNLIKTTLAESQPSPIQYVFLIFYGAFSIPWSLLSFTASGIYSIGAIIFDITLGSVGSTSFSSIGGILTLVSGVIIAGLIVVLVFSIIKSIRTGDA